jgi:hypothetical protein
MFPLFMGLAASPGEASVSIQLVKRAFASEGLAALLNKMRSGLLS